jgi:tryptophan 7-halogenase
MVKPVKKYKFVVVGGGTAGIIAATKLVTSYGDSAEVVMIYDHKNPGIGVGESLTPLIRSFLEDINVDQAELIKNVNATVKIGLKFKNWLNDGKYFYHGFNQFQSNSTNISAAYDISQNIYDGDCMYPSFYYENNIIPYPYVQSRATATALHIDATLFSKFIENKFKDKITIIDDVVTDVIKKGNNIISLKLKKSGILEGDFFVDATGFQRVLMNRLTNKWIDMSKSLPIDRFIPNPVHTAPENLPPYTISEATDNGWILQVPLQNRWGTGYLYCSKFTTDEEAINKFSIWSKDNYNAKLTSPKVLSFESGYWHDQWVGNCIVTGLASGFAEPLEATNIHHSIYQLNKFCNIFNFKVFEHDVTTYNATQRELYKNIYLYLGFCYTTGRTDSKFWKYITNNIPDDVKNLEDKVKNDYISLDNIDGPMFKFENFTCIANGLNKFNRSNIESQLRRRNLFNTAKLLSEQVKTNKLKYMSNTTNSKAYVELMCSK